MKILESKEGRENAIWKVAGESFSLFPFCKERRPNICPYCIGQEVISLTLEPPTLDKVDVGRLYLAASGSSRVNRLL